MQNYNTEFTKIQDCIISKSDEFIEKYSKQIAKKITQNEKYEDDIKDLLSDIISNFKEKTKRLLEYKIEFLEINIADLLIKSIDDETNTVVKIGNILGEITSYFFSALLTKGVNFILKTGIKAGIKFGAARKIISKVVEARSNLLKNKSKTSKNKIILIKALSKLNEIDIIEKLKNWILSLILKSIVDSVLKNKIKDLIEHELNILKDIIDEKIQAEYITPLKEKQTRIIEERDKLDNKNANLEQQEKEIKIDIKALEQIS